MEDMLAVGDVVRIPRRKGRELIAEVAHKCKPILAKEYRKLG